MPDAKVFDMPMELGLKLVAIIRAHLANAQISFARDTMILGPRMTTGGPFLQLAAESNINFYNLKRNYCIAATNDYFYFSVRLSFA